MSYIASLNMIGDDSPAPISEDALREELSLWANAQFTFDMEPGSALLDDFALQKQSSKQNDIFSTIGRFSTPNVTAADHRKELLQDTSITPTMMTSSPFSLLDSAAGKPTHTLPLIAPAPIGINKTQGSPTSRTAVIPGVEKKRKQGDIEPEEKAAAEEDKRKRNTAASARFRKKKKLRELAMEEKSKDMESKVEILENRIKELEMEAKWLRALVIEKDPKLLEVSVPTSTSFS